MFGQGMEIVRNSMIPISLDGSIMISLKKLITSRKHLFIWCSIECGHSRTVIRTKLVVVDVFLGS